MDLSPSSMIPFLIYSSINTGHPACLSFTFQICALSMVFSAIFRALRYVKFDCHWSYYKSIDSSLPCLLHHFHSLLKFYWILLQTSVLDVISSRSQTFFLGISSCCADFLTAPKFPVSRQVSQNFSTAPSSSTVLKFSVTIPYRNESLVVVFQHAKFLHCTEIFRRALLPRHELLWLIFVYRAKILLLPLLQSL
jgi:hypothetical protein